NFRQRLGLCQLGKERARLFAEQNAQAMDGLNLGGLQLRNQCARRFKLRRLALHIKLGAESRLRSNLGEVQRILLELDVLIRDVQALLKSPQLGVIPCDLCQQADERVAARLADCSNVSGCSFQRASPSAKEIDFPTRVEPELVDTRFERREQTG